MTESLHITQDMWWTIFGATLAIIGCIFQAIGFIIQKIAHNQIEQHNKTDHKDEFMLKDNVCYDADAETCSEEDGAETRGPPHKNEPQSPSRFKKKERRYIQNKTWLLGFFLNGIVGSLLNIIALNYAPQSVVLPLSATTLVGNTILATKYLDEPFPIQDCVGVILVILGSIVTIIVGPKQTHSDDVFTVLVLQSRWINPVFLIFSSSISLLICMDLLVLKILNTANKRKKAALIENRIVYYLFFHLTDP
eukprot:373576_1